MSQRMRIIQYGQYDIGPIGASRARLLEARPGLPTSADIPMAYFVGQL